MAVLEWIAIIFIALALMSCIDEWRAKRERRFTRPRAQRRPYDG